MGDPKALAVVVPQTCEAAMPAGRDGFLDREHPGFCEWAGRMCDGPDAHYAPLIEAVMTNAVRLAMIGPGLRQPVLKATYCDRRPHLVILRDADAGRTGPSGFPMAGAVLRWGYRSVIRLAEPAAEQYGAALDYARRYQRVVMVEMVQANAASWAEAIGTSASPRDPSIAVIRPGESVNLMPARKRRTRG